MFLIVSSITGYTIPTFRDRVIHEAQILGFKWNILLLLDCWLDLRPTPSIGAQMIKVALLRLGECDS